MMRSFISSALMNLKPYSYLLELITVLRMRSPNIVFLIQLSLAVVVVMWSACSTSTPTIRVRIPLTSTVYSVKFVFEKNENKQKRPGLAHFKKNSTVSVLYRLLITPFNEQNVNNGACMSLWQNCTEGKQNTSTIDFKC